MNLKIAPAPLGALSLLLLSLAPAAEAAIVYSGLKDIPIPTDLDGVYLDLDTGSTATSSFTGWDINPFYGGYAIANSPTFQPGRLTTAVDSTVLNLAFGTSSGSGTLTVASTYAGSEGHLGSGAGQFPAGVDGYLGFQFDPGGGAGPYYGWMRVVLTANAAGGLIRDWAYQTDGTSMLVGDTGLTTVPEPGQGLVVSGGLVALCAWVGCRRARRKPAA